MTTTQAATQPRCFEMRVGSTTFQVNVHYDERSGETLEQKMLRMITREVAENA